MTGMLVELGVDHVLDIVGLRVECMLVGARKVFVTALQHVANVDVLLVVRSVVGLMPLNCLLLCIFYCIFVSVMILLSGVEADSICPDRDVSSFVRGCLDDRGVVQVTILVVLD